MTNLEIEAFLAVYQHKNISKAAAELYIKHSSLSTRLKTLENEVGYELFVRRKGQREITPTTEGRAFYAFALQYQDLIKKMKTIQELTPRTTLRVGSFGSIESCLLPSVCERFIQNYPHIQLFLQSIVGTPVIRRCIKSDKTDIVFSSNSILSDQITSTPFLTERMAFICAEDSDYPEIVDLESLSMENEIYFKWWSEYMHWHRSVFGPNNTQRIRVENISQLAAFVSQPNRWAIVPHSVARSLATTPYIQQCRMAFTVPDHTVYIVTGPNVAKNEDVHLFLNCFREVFLEQQIKGTLL